jgi:hypothetical protein
VQRLVDVRHIGLARHAAHRQVDLQRHHAHSQIMYSDMHDHLDRAAYLF